MTKDIEKLQELIDNHDNIVFFGGAGVSTESGIPDFRSQNGLYNMKYEYPPETILSKQFFKKFPEEFFKFYRDKMLCDAVKPNAAHLSWKKLEKLRLLLRRTLTICIRWPEAKMYWSCMEAYTAIIVRNAERHTALITLRILMEYRSVNAVELSSLM